MKEGNGTAPYPDGGTQYNSCCDVVRAGVYPEGKLDIYPVAQAATRDDDFKLVRKQVDVCGASSADDTVQTQNEFYQINEDKIKPCPRQRWYGLV